MGAHWGGCDDVRGPVLVWAMTNGFRKLQSPPLGGAIPSAVSPEVADTLEHRETFHPVCHVTFKKSASTTQHSHCLSNTIT